MKLKFILILSVGFAILSLFSFSERKLLKTITVKAADTTKSDLYLYGQYIYKREQCNKCHSLNSTENKELVSLDGLKGKYPKNWHYNLLINPSYLIINATMPSFAYLKDKLFKKDSIFNNIHPISNQDWHQVLYESNEIKKELKKLDIIIKSNSEMIALIAFLDNIPESDEQQKASVIESEKFMKENKDKDSLWANSERIIRDAIRDSNNVKKGQILFMKYCRFCHGEEGGGLIGPNLTDSFWLHGHSDEIIIKTIEEGVPDKGMIAWRNQLTPLEVGQLVAYINSIYGTKPRNPKMKQGSKE